MITSIAQMQNEKITGKDMIKTAIGVVVGIGVDMTISTLIGHHLPILKGWRKMMVRIGTFALAMRIGEETENYFYKAFEETEATLKKAKKELDNVDNAPKEEEQKDGRGQ